MEIIRQRFSQQQHIDKQSLVWKLVPMGKIQDDDKIYKHHAIQLGDRSDKSRPNKFMEQKGWRELRIEKLETPYLHLLLH